jgi:hypothetical protein
MLRGPDRLQVEAELGLDNSVRCVLRHRAATDAEGWLISIWVTASMYLVGGVDKTNGTAAQQKKTIGWWPRSKFRSRSSSTEQSGSTRLGSGQSGSRIKSTGIVVRKEGCNGG